MRVYTIFQYIGSENIMNAKLLYCNYLHLHSLFRPITFAYGTGTVEFDGVHECTSTVLPKLTYLHIGAASLKK